MAKYPVWVHLALNVLEFHEESQREFGITNPGRPSGARDGWSIRNTAEAKRMSIGKCHNLLIVAKALKKNGNISRATSFNAAVKLAKRELHGR